MPVLRLPLEPVSAVSKGVDLRFDKGAFGPGLDPSGALIEEVV